MAFSRGGGRGEERDARKTQPLLVSQAWLLLSHARRGAFLLSTPPRAACLRTCVRVCVCGRHSLAAASFEKGRPLGPLFLFTTNQETFLSLLRSPHTSPKRRRQTDTKQADASSLSVRPPLLPVLRCGSDTA